MPNYFDYVIIFQEEKFMEKRYIQCVQNDNINNNVKDTILAIKNAGFDGVFLQWYNKDWNFSQEEQLSLAKKLNLEIAFAHLGYKGINNIWIEGEEGDKLVENYILDLEACRKNNINLVVMHLSSKSIAPEPSIIGINRLQKIINHAENLNIKIAFENTKIWGYLEYVFEHIKNKNIGVCIDTGHMHCHFNDKFSWDIFKNKIFAVHIHDNDKTKDAHLLPYDGTIDWQKLIDNLKLANYNGPVIMESCYSPDYAHMSLEDFYALSLKRAKELPI